MSIGFSLSDCAEAYRLALKLHRTFFTKAERADVKYIEFGTEIRYLGKSAERLYDVFTQTINKYSEHRSHHEDTDHHINTAAAEALRQITGNFLQTLQDCERLLSNNSKFKRTKANFVDNVVWHSSTELDINKLRQRVHFHQTKINFITKPFELQLQSDIHRELKYLSRNVTEVKKGVTEIKKVLTGNAAKASDSDSSTSSEGPLAIPSDLELRFTKALAVNSPGTFQAQDNLPIREAFDALMFHFDRSTVTFKPNPGLGNSEPEHSQYLNLIKSKWILGKLKESINFRSAGQESFWAECVRKIEGKIRDQLDRFQNRELCAPPLGNLFLLPDNYFSIWVDEVSSLHPSALTEEPPLEEKILELPLSNPYPNHHQFTLTIFRKSDVTFRLVSTTKDGQNQDFYKEESVVINMVHTQLMPNFADSKDVSNDKNNVLICENHSQPREYTLQNLDHVALFQRALTGFRVSHDMSEIKLHIEYQNISKAAVSGNARIQLWHLKPLPKILPPDESPPINNDSSSTAKSAHSPSESANLRRFWTSGTSQYAESIFVSPVIGSCGDGVALLRPELPVLVIFTECENKHNFFHLRLDEHVFVEQQFCKGCKIRNEACSRVLVKSSRKLALTRTCAEPDSGQGLYSLDLAHFMYPEHPRFKDLETQRKIKYISLHFKNQEKADEFLTEFKVLENWRNYNLTSYKRVLNDRKFAANNHNKYS